MSNVDWTAIRADYEGGLSLRALAAKYSMSKSAIGKRKFQERWKEPSRGRSVDSVWTVDSGQARSSTQSTPIKKDLSTKDRQRLFLEAFALHANVMVSAREAGIHRSTVYEWLEKDSDFSFAYNLAKEDAKDTLKEEIYKRAHDGWNEEVYQFGQFAGTVHKYSDTLLIFHAKMLMPEYRDKSQLDVNAHHTSAQDVRNLQEAIMQALESHPEAKFAVAQALMDKARDRQR